MQPSAALGIQLYTPLVRSFAVVLVALALGLGVLTLGVALLADRRRTVRSVIPALVLLLASGLVGSGGYRWFGDAAAQAIPNSPLDVQLGAWVIQSHTLAATGDWAQGRIAGHSTLHLAPAQPITTTRLVLRLNPGIALTTARLPASGQLRQLALQPEGDSVEITLPAPPTAMLTLDLHWAGTPRPPTLITT